MGSYKNLWASYRIRSSPTPTYPKLRGCKSETTDWAYHMRSSSSLITIVVMTLLICNAGLRFMYLDVLACLNERFWSKHGKWRIELYIWLMYFLPSEYSSALGTASRSISQWHHNRLQDSIPETWWKERWCHNNWRQSTTFRHHRWTQSVNILKLQSLLSFAMVFTVTKLCRISLCCI